MEAVKEPWKAFLGVTVLVQLKGPIVGVVVRHKQALDYANEKSAQWVPEGLQSADGSPAATQLVMFAVLRESHHPSFLVMDWQSLPDDPNAPSVGRKPATLSSLIPVDAIGFVTRVVSVREPSLITL